MTQKKEKIENEEEKEKKKEEIEASPVFLCKIYLGVVKARFVD